VGMLFRLFPCQSHSKGGPPVTGRLMKLCRYWMPQKTSKGDALRKEQVLLHTFVAGQKYGVGRDDTTVLGLLKKKTTGNRLSTCCPLYYEFRLLHGTV